MKVLSRFGCLLLLVVAPAWARQQAPASPATTVTVFAAASLRESLDSASSEWTKESGQKVVVSYAASSDLARQIEHGAPANVFISADTQWMDALQQRHLIDPATRFDLVGNQLVLIVPATSPQQSVALVRNFFLEVLGDGRLSMADTTSVPAGRYGRQSLVKLGIWDAVSGHLAESDNVRTALQFVALGDAPLGIVYSTDAKAEPKVRVVATFPDDSHVPIVYPAARVASTDAGRTRGFLAFLRGPAATAIFRDAGFRIPEAKGP